MSTARSDRLAAIAAVLSVAAIGGCEALIGADFDVEAAPAGDGGGGGATTGATAGTTATSASTGGGGSTTSTGAGGCPVDAASLAEGERLPWDVVVDDTFVYWSSPGIPLTAPDGAIRRARKDGSGDVEVVAAGQAQPNRLVIAGRYLYWTATGSADQDGAVRFVDRSAPAEVVTVAADLALPLGIATDDAAVYFVDRAPIDVGGAPHMSAYRAAHGEASPALFAAVPSFPTLVATGAGVLFGGSLETPSTGTLWTLALDGSQAVATRLLTSAPRPDAGIAHGGGTFAVTSVASGRIDLYSPFGDLVREGQADAFGAPADVAFADGWFYFAEFGGATIWRTSTTSAEPECVVTGQPSVNGVATDGDRLYFTLHAEDGAVRSVPLPR